MTGVRSIFGAIGVVAIPLLSAIILVAPSRAVRAQVPADLEAGHKLGMIWCSNCHVVSPEQQSGNSTGAPTFAAIANAKTTTELGLHAFLQTPHDRMPDLHLDREEIDNVAAYIISLRQPTRS
jgi:mono/diheme cytochrome c family protein